MKVRLISHLSIQECLDRLDLAVFQPRFSHTFVPRGTWVLKEMVVGRIRTNLTFTINRQGPNTYLGLTPRFEGKLSEVSMGTKIVGEVKYRPVWPYLLITFLMCVLLPLAILLAGVLGYIANLPLLLAISAMFGFILIYGKPWRWFKYNWEGEEAYLIAFLEETLQATWL